MMDVRRRAFVVPYDADCRFRHTHIRVKRQVTAFVVQLEVFVQGQWHAIVRYDTAHGFAHRDLVHADGRTEKLPLPIQDFNEALTFAELDLDENWMTYRERFLKEARGHD